MTGFALSSQFKFCGNLHLKLSNTYETNGDKGTACDL